MTFSAQLKSSLAKHKPSKRCCRLAELSAIIRLTGKIRHEDGDPVALTLTASSSPAMRTAKDLLIHEFSVKPHLEVQHTKAFGRNHRYLLNLEDPAHLTQILHEVGVLDEHLETATALPGRIIKEGCCRISYARGAFLSAGSMSHPHASYHLEVTSHDHEWGAAFADLLNKLGIKAKLSHRRSSSVVYLKGSGEISSFLALVGGHQPLLELEDVLVRRQVSSQINRLVNCDSANAGKTAAASEKQHADIAYLDATVGLDSLPAALQEIAAIRAEYPDVSIAELAELSTPPLSKSAVAHRLRRLSLLAEQARLLSE